MTCRTCRHDRDFHTHHRPGTDCSRCPCPRYSRWWPPIKPPAGERPSPGPAARATSPARAPLPGPILRAGGNFTRTRRITTDIDETCGCAITHDSKLPGIVMEPCGQHEFDLADWERRLPA